MAVELHAVLAMLAHNPSWNVCFPRGLTEGKNMTVTLLQPVLS